MANNSAEEFKLLKFKRNKVKTNLLSFQTFLKTLDDVEISQIHIAQLNCRLEKVQPLYDEFIQYQTDIEYIVEMDDTVEISLADHQKEIKEKETFENDYFDAISKSNVIIEQYGASQHIEINPENNSCKGSIRQNVKLTPTTYSVKLPEMKLPKFSGSFEKWLEFREAFTSIIDKNDSLDTIQKFYYLRAHLEGEAAQMLESIQVTESNYQVALSLLKQRYENNRLIIFNHIKALFDAPSLVKESHTDLRNLYDQFNKNIRSLEVLGQPTEQWSVLLIYLLTSKFDYRTRRDWEAYKIKGELPTLTDLNNYLKEKCNLLEKLEIVKNDSNSNFKYQNKRVLRTTNSYVSNDKKFTCFYCKLSHSIFKCTSFSKLDIVKRNSEAKRLKLCLNCLNPNHDVQECTKAPCRYCSKNINSLLHSHKNISAISNNSKSNEQIREAGNSAPFQLCEKIQQSESSTNQLNEKEKDTNNIIVTQTSLLGQTNKYALLCTASVLVENKNKQFFKATMLLDPGSQSNFVTENFCDKLKLDKQKINFAIFGIGNNDSVSTKYKTNLKVNSSNGGFSKEICCLILPKITQPMPVCTFDDNLLNIPRDINLADSEFNVKKEIDILCGVGFFFEILLMNQIKLDKHLTLQATKLGWVLGGEISYSSLMNNKIISCLSIDEQINKNLSRFWEIEECNTDIKVDNLCETHFKENFRRDNDGRFVVKIPFKENINQLGNSKEIALKRFDMLERRLSNNPDIKQQYEEFMSEYERLGHMTVLNENIKELSDGNAYYLSHHAVVKTTSLTTRLRVVFDGSACTDNGVSLNDIQFVGPTVQNDLFNILLNFRKYAYVLNADISKMYRQVVVDKADRRYQRIFWRSKSSETLKCYELNVVTYGLASSPYLATRCLLQIAIDNERDYPLASNVIKNCFYVDDLLTGSDSEDELLQLQKDISKILSNAGFELRKYLSNKPELFDKFEINKSLDASILRLGENENNKTLGIYWNSNNDTIQYQIKNNSDFSIVTKRSILSAISQIFDILGLLGPIIIRAKIIMQMIWKEKLSWDQEVSKGIREKWILFCEDLNYLNNIQIPRHVFYKNVVNVELHVFADASESSYGACAYIRCKITDNEYSCKLIAAKSKVAPVRPVTLPRLELTSAVLACKLAEKIKNSLGSVCTKCYYWSDSTITLCWIKGIPDRWKKFVSNRVGVIQNKTNIDDWFHVRSQDNPADLISRGTSAKNLMTNESWFEGPHWLKLDKSCWPDNIVINVDSEIPEQRIVSNLTIAENDWNIFSKFSNLITLQRVVAYCKRFIFNVRHIKTERTMGELTPKELNDALLNLIKIAQVQTFRTELNDLKNKGSVNNSSSILPLNPFLEDDVIRVGGRIQKANVSYSKKHPIILHNKHKLTELIMTNEHIRLMHCGPQQLLYSVRERFWPVSGRNVARKIVRKCIICFKIKPKPCHYLMGNLPSERLNQCVPFVNTGCDYAGFFLIKDRKTRGFKLIKAYVCIFICMVTKAIHLELVTSLDSEAFLAVFRRFVSRRGKPLNMYTDNGTTFIGANTELKNFLKSNSDKIKHNLSDEGVTWHFIPPRAAHFGGLWEAGVKSFKQHLKRVVGNTNLDYEDFMTVLNQIESILNSRPLSPLSSSPEDFLPLTPGHFLIGRPLVSLPDPNVIDVKENRLARYQRLQQIIQHFWSRWHKEYISELQCRQRWRQDGSAKLRVGDLVIVREDHLPPLQWKLARILQLFPGEDSVVRVVALKFSDGKCARRALNKVCLLPVEDDIE